MKNYITLSIIFIFSALFSIVNQLVYAHYFGASAAFDVLNAALSLSFPFIGILSGVVSLVFMPILSKLGDSREKASLLTILFVKKYYKFAIVISLAVFLLQTLFLYDSMPINFKKEFVLLGVFSALHLCVSFLNSFFIAFYNFQKKYILASVNSVLTYLVSIVFCLLFAKAMGTMAVAVSLVMSGVMLMLLFWFNMDHNDKKKHPELVYSMNLKTSAVLSGAMSIFPFTIPTFIDAIYLTPLDPGSLSYASYANKFVVLSATIIIQPLNLILFPKILGFVNKGRHTEVSALLKRLYMYAIIFGVLIYLLVDLFFLYFMGEIFESGEFSSEDSLMVYNLLKLYLIGSVGMALMNIQNKVMAALQYYTPQIGFAAGFLCVYLLIIDVQTESHGYLGSGYAYMLSWVVYSIIAALYIAKFNKSS